MSKDGTRPLAGQHGDGAYDLAPSAGRELDALIAEKVMGWTNVGVKQMYSIAGGDFGQPSTLVTDGVALRGEPPNAPTWAKEQAVPPYSTDIAAAWTILKRIRENWIFSKRERFFNALKQETRLTDGTSIAWPAALIAWQDSFPEKLCRAAITAVSAAPGRADD